VRQLIEDEGLRGALEKEASETAGRPIRVAFRVSEPVEEEPPSGEAEGSEDEGSEAEVSEDELFERAIKDPLVRGFVSTFRGKVEEVLALDSGSPDEQGSDGIVKR
jgi:hypothetical protein